MQVDGSIPIQWLLAKPLVGVARLGLGLGQFPVFGVSESTHGGRF